MMLTFFFFKGFMNEWLRSLWKQFCFSYVLAHGYIPTPKSSLGFSFVLLLIVLKSDLELDGKNEK